MKIKYVVSTRKIFTSLNKMIKCKKINPSIEIQIVELVKWKSRKDIPLTNLLNVYFKCDVFQANHTLKCQNRIELCIKS